MRKASFSFSREMPISRIIFAAIGEVGERAKSVIQSGELAWRANRALIAATSARENVGLTLIFFIPEKETKLSSNFPNKIISR